MPRFAANLSWLYGEAPFEQRPALAHRDGFTAVECLFPYETMNAGRFRTQLDQQALSLVLFNAPPGDWMRGDRGMAIFPERQEEFRRHLLDTALPYADITGCQRLHIMAGVLSPEDNPERAREMFLENLSWACNQVTSHTVSLVIEPINDTDMPGYFLTRQEQAHRLVADINSPRLGVQMDLYHCQRMEGQVWDEIMRYLPGGKVHHMQIAGHPGRHEPLAGTIPYPAIFDLVDRLGYPGYLGCEYSPLAQTQDGLAQWLPSNFKLGKNHV